MLNDELIIVKIFINDEKKKELVVYYVKEPRLHA